MSDIPPEEARVLFALAKDPDGNNVCVLLVPRDGWIYMKDGKNHNFDLTKAGLPFKIVMGGCKNRADGMKMLEAMQGYADIGPDKTDLKKDFGITVAPYQTGEIRGKDD